MPNSQFAALAERCEQATGSDEELDMLIDCALKGIIPVYPTEGHPMTPGRGGRIEAKNTFELLGWIDPGEVASNFSPFGGYPPVTASLDAAMTLVPERWRIAQAEDNADFSGKGFHVRVSERRDDLRGKPKDGDAATFALALCAAALRAKDQADAR